MTTVLITGAHGFIGRYCAREFSGHGYRAIGLGYGKWGYQSHEEFGIHRWIEAAVDSDSLLSIAEPVHIVVHCAGSGSVGYSVTNPMQDFQMTVDTTLAVLEFMRIAAPDATLVYPSSAAVYGCRDVAPISEGDPLQPVSPYGCHKKIAEELCASYVRNFGLKASIIRFFSIYGAGLRKQLLWEACRKLLGLSDSSVGEFFGTGDETRDWLHVRDAARLVRTLGERPQDGLVVNGGTGTAVRVLDVLTHLAAEVGWKGRLAFNGTVRSGDPQHQCADIALARSLGWSPSISLQDGLREYVAWFAGVMTAREAEEA
jgi:UDP-glucose 4-epimerase